MRRIFAPILIGLGVFLLVAMALVKFYAYPQLAVAPKDQDSVTNLTATDAVIFDTDPNLLTEVNTDLAIANTTRGDVEAAEAIGDDACVWADTSTITSEDGAVRSQSASSTVFDCHTGAAITDAPEGDTWVEDEEDVQVPVQREGQTHKFPFNTGQETYQWWDDSALTTVPAEFEQVTDIDGLEVYEFVADFPATVIGTRDVPPAIVGETGSDDVAVDVSYANKRTFWVEPHTGVVIKRCEDQNSTLQVDGEDRATTTRGTFCYTDEQVAANVDEYQDKAMLLGLVDGIWPWVGFGLGIVLIVLGVFLRMGSGRGTGSAKPTSSRSPQPAATA